jgi:hypothetical protein
MLEAKKPHEHNERFFGYEMKVWLKNGKTINHGECLCLFIRNEEKYAHLYIGEHINEKKSDGPKIVIEPDKETKLDLDEVIRITYHDFTSKKIASYNPHKHKTSP